MGLRDRAVQAVGDVAHGLAHAAALTGVPVYTPVLDRPSGIAGGLNVDKWAIELDAIESAGWHLEHWQVDGGRAYPVFRRVVDEQVIDH